MDNETLEQLGRILGTLSGDARQAFTVYLVVSTVPHLIGGIISALWTFVGGVAIFRVISLARVGVEALSLSDDITQVGRELGLEQYTPTRKILRILHERATALKPKTTDDAVVP